MNNIYKSNFEYTFYLISYKYSKQRKYKKPINIIDSVVLRCKHIEQTIDVLVDHLQYLNLDNETLTILSCIEVPNSFINKL